MDNKYLVQDAIEMSKRIKALRRSGFKVGIIFKRGEFVLEIKGIPTPPYFSP